MENSNRPESKRLLSLDALRGFDMLWIMGGGEISVALAGLTGWPVLKWWAEQQEHVPWHGFHFEDMIFPLFLFIAGISFPFSLAKRYHGAENRKALYRHVITRGLVLVLLGIVYNNAINFDFANLRYASVLGRIGLGWMFAALIYMNTTTIRTKVIWFWGIIVAYWLLLLAFPAHDLGTYGPFTMQGNLPGHIDRLLLPGKFCCYNYGDSEGIMSTIPAISTALLGMLTGTYIRSSYLSNNPTRKVLYMALTAIGLMIIGQVWNLFFPINKYLWSSSFVCWVGGLSMLLFSVFYLVIDVWNYKKWTLFFVVIGMNPITIYLAQPVIGFNHATQFFFGGLVALAPQSWGSLLNSIGYVAVGWVFLYFLYKKKIFLKV